MKGSVRPLTDSPVSQCWRQAGIAIIVAIVGSFTELTVCVPSLSSTYHSNKEEVFPVPKTGFSYSMNKILKSEAAVNGFIQNFHRSLVVGRRSWLASPFVLLLLFFLCSPSFCQESIRSDLCCHSLRPTPVTALLPMWTLSSAMSSGTKHLISTLCPLHGGRTRNNTAGIWWKEGSKAQRHREGCLGEVLLPWG